MPEFPIGAAATLHQLEGPSPYALLARLREDEPVSWLPAIGGWLVTRRELALQAMRDSRTFTVEDPRFTTARVVGPSMLSLDGSEHDRHRAPFVAPLRLGQVRERLAAGVEEEVERLLDDLEPAGAAELRRGFAGPLAAAVVTRALGIEAAAVATVLSWYDAIVAAVTDLTAGRPPSPAAAEAVAALGEAVQAAPGSPLSADEFTSNAAVMLFGGIETTEGMIANAIAHLLANPEARALVRAEPQRLPAAVEESLRLEPAAAVIDRYATAGTELGGARIAAGDLVRLSITAANRDPDTFPDPDRFDPRRENAGRHLAFAAGPHVCVGMHLARLEAHTAIARLLDRLPSLRLADGPPEVHGLVFRKPPALNVVWGQGRPVPRDYDADPERFRLARAVQRAHALRADIHPLVARRFIDAGLTPVLDIGCGEGELARHLPPGAWVGVDGSAAMLERAPRPHHLADATALPFADGSFPAVALLYVLYHLPEPRLALEEARRVLEPGGLIAVAAPSRHDSPELAHALPQARLTFDAELAPDLLAELLEDVEVERWDAPLLELPSREAVRDYVAGKGGDPDAAGDIEVPLTVTKRGALLFARRPG